MCDIDTRYLGNQFAVRSSSSAPNALPTAAGSHLDTQPLGGRYDGILGVTAGIALLRALHASNTTTNYPVAVVNWTNEEGARFPISMVSSGVWAGSFPQEKAYDLRSVVPGEEQMSMKTELERIGYKGTVPCNHQDGVKLAAHLELHIEQGPLLENSGRHIGVVTGVQSYVWSTWNITGRASHTGTTDLNSRSDALLAAAKMIVRARELARENGALATVGIIEAKPGAVNTIPGSVRMSLDVRGRTNEIRARTFEACQTEFAAISTGKDKRTQGPQEKVQLQCQIDSMSEAVQFHEDCIGCVKDATRDLFGEDKMMEITSGAGHDSVYTSKRVPTSMIFVPCKGGISHNPEEFSSPEDCARGAQVLGDAVLRYDELRKSRES